MRARRGGRCGSSWRCSGSSPIYVPVLLLFGVTVVTEDERVDTVATAPCESPTARRASPVAVGGGRRSSPWLPPPPASPGGGRAGRCAPSTACGRSPRTSRRPTSAAASASSDGPAEVVALAASFDAMLDRLEHAAADAAPADRGDEPRAAHPAGGARDQRRRPARATRSRRSRLYRDGLERSKAAAVRLQATIDELLVDARGRARTHRPPARPTCGAVVRRRRRRGPRAGRRRGDVAARRSTGPPAAPCPLDEPTVTRAVANLVDNAIRHAPDGLDRRRRGRGSATPSWRPSP